MIALGFSTNDAFTIDNVTTELPEPANAGLVALTVLALLRRGRRATP